MSLKVDKRGLDKKIQKLKQWLNESRKQRIYKNLGARAAQIIYKRVKSGYGVDDDSREKPIKDKLNGLSPSYKFARKTMSSTGGEYTAFKTKAGEIVQFELMRPVKFGAFFSPGRSNLTLTGQMLEAIDYRVTSKGFVIFIKNTTRDDGLTNREVAEHVTEQGRPFLALTQGEQRVISDRYRTIILKLANKLK